MNDSMSISRKDVGFIAPPTSHATKASDLDRLDRVRISSGQIFIVTKRTGRPANCWAGVLETGHGKEYIFGPKHRPIKLGVVTEDHHALRLNTARKANHGQTNDANADDSRLDGTARALIGRLLDHIDQGEFGKSKAIAESLRAIGF